MHDEPTTVAGLRNAGQIDLPTRDDAYQRDDLRAARGMIVGPLLGFLVICAVCVLAFLLR